MTLAWMAITLATLGVSDPAHAQFRNSLWIGTDNVSSRMVLNTDRTGTILRQDGPVEATGFAIDLAADTIYFGTSTGGIRPKDLTTLVAGSSFTTAGTEDMTFDGQYIWRAGKAGPAASPMIQRIDPALHAVSGSGISLPFDALGIAWDGSGFWIGEFNFNGLIERFDTAGNPTGQSFHTSGNFTNGGLAYDNTDNTLFIGSFGHVYHYTTIGTQLGSFTLADNRFVDGLEFQPAPPLPGDYNQNAIVDPADYVVWRKAGATDYLPNDITPGTVNASDYSVWRAHFGQTAGSGTSLGATGSASAVPEPATVTLFLIAICCAALGRRSASSGTV
jgi:hypothetical protein